eukprot:2986656-Rhodomonas_salina.1
MPAAQLDALHVTGQRIEDQVAQRRVPRVVRARQHVRQRLLPKTAEAAHEIDGVVRQRALGGPTLGARQLLDSGAASARPLQLRQRLLQAPILHRQLVVALAVVPPQQRDSLHGLGEHDRDRRARARVELPVTVRVDPVLKRLGVARARELRRASAVVQTHGLRELGGSVLQRRR